MHRLHGIQDRSDHVPRRIHPGTDDTQRYTDEGAETHRNEHHADGAHGLQPVRGAEEATHDQACSGHETDLGCADQGTHDDREDHDLVPGKYQQEVVDDVLEQEVKGPLDGVQEPLGVEVHPVDNLVEPVADGQLELVKDIGLGQPDIALAARPVASLGGKYPGGEAHRKTSLSKPSTNCSTRPISSMIS